MLGLTTKQSRQALAITLIVYVAGAAAVIAWLEFNGEDTATRRMAQSPNTTVQLPGKAPEVPESWQTPPVLPPVVETPAAIPPVTPPVTPAATKPEEKPVTPEKAKPVEPEVKAEAPKVETPPVAATPLPPAVTTNMDAAPPPQRWQKFARPFDQKDTRPRIGLIIADLGMASAATDAAIQELPGEVSLAFSSAAPDLEGWLAKGRAAGHEMILTIPMEPQNYPQNDPGPNTLLLSLPDKDNIDRINRAMARGDGYVAVTPYMGEKFVTAEDKLAPVLDAVKEQQLMILDGTMNKDSLIAPLSRLGHVPFVRSDIILDAAASGQAIEDQLDALEKLARAKGQVIGVALPYPVTFEKLKAWIATLDKKGIVLAPLTAIASEDVITPVITATPVPPAPTSASTTSPAAATSFTPPPNQPLPATPKAQ